MSVTTSSIWCSACEYHVPSADWHMKTSLFNKLSLRWINLPLGRFVRIVSKSLWKPVLSSHLARPSEYWITQSPFHSRQPELGHQSYLRKWEPLTGDLKNPSQSECPTFSIWPTKVIFVTSASLFLVVEWVSWGQMFGKLMSWRIYFCLSQPRTRGEPSEGQFEKIK